jgi:rare lipoprotein A
LAREWSLGGERASFQALGTSTASRTLPLGTRARLTNLDTGRSAEVQIDDRGPYVPGRFIHVSLGTARMLGMEKRGLARVRIKPLTR